MSYEISYEIRKIRPGEVEEALDLALRVFMEFEAPEYSPRGAETFKEHIRDEQTIQRYKSGESPMYAAFDNGKIIGIIGMRPNKTHISLVFVDKNYHRKGVGSALFRFLIGDLSERKLLFSEMTVNSSPYGVPFYKSLGFVLQSEEQEADGIRYTPMKIIVPQYSGDFRTKKAFAAAQKVAELEYAVINSSPREVSEAYKHVGRVEFSARALGIACRYRGLDHVKALVEGGASFEYPFTYYMKSTFYTYADDYRVMLLDNFPKGGIMLFAVTRIIYHSLKNAKGEELKPLSFEERAKIVEYLCEHGEKAAFIPGDLLYYAILFRDERMTELLKKRGVTLTEYRRKLLTEKGKPDDLRVWTSVLDRLPAENFAPMLNRLREEVGEKFHNTKGIYEAVKDKLYLPDALKAYLDNFDEPSPNKTELMKLAVDNNSPEGLSFMAEAGWLSSPKKRDELIQYASEQKRAECAAWLLDFKNRTADFAAEREKAEKKQEREFNAAPDSAAVLKTLWSFKKCEDGTLVIKDYKGDKTEFSVPGKIGKSIVTAIGDEAFTPYLGGVIKKTNGRFLRTITSVTLPESIAEIGDKAFEHCCGLCSVNIPASVTAIGIRAFYDCEKLTVTVTPGSYAEGYCRENNIHYELKGN